MHCFHDPPCSDLLTLRLLMKEVGFELNDDRTPGGSSLRNRRRFAPGGRSSSRHLERAHVIPAEPSPLKSCWVTPTPTKMGASFPRMLPFMKPNRPCLKLPKLQERPFDSFMAGAGPLGAAAVLAAPYLLHQQGRCTARSGLPNKGKSSASGTPCLKLPTGTLNKSSRLPSLRQMMGTKTTMIWTHPFCVNWPKSPCGIIASSLRMMTFGLGSLPPLRSKPLRDSPSHLDRYHAHRESASIRKSSRHPMGLLLDSNARPGAGLVWTGDGSGATGRQ